MDNRKVLPVYNIWYHCVPIKSFSISKGIMSPRYMYEHGYTNLAIDATYKYRMRLCNGWGIYPDRDPKSLSIEEVLDGLDKFRGEGGSKAIYLFRYPPKKELGKNMRDFLRYHDILEVDLSKVPDIVSIDYGYINSNTDNDRIDPEYYKDISYEDYFSNYDDNTTGLLFAKINHISVITESGKITKSAIRLI